MAGDLIVVVPARGGSQRVPKKNIRALNGKPLIAYTLEAAIGAGLQDHVVVSTDDVEIRAVAEHFGVRALHRPAELAAAASSTESVLLHALEVVAGEGWNPHRVMTLPPTSPFRRAATLSRFVSIAATSDADCVFSLTENRGDFWRVTGNGDLQRIFPDAPRRQQDRKPLFEENSAIYVTRAEALIHTGFILGKSQCGVVIDPLEGFDVNTEFDFALAAALIAAGAAPTQAPAVLATTR